ncbi:MULTISPECIES: tyrosine-protein phosphatase [unclassified Streptomyces]|nr:MULTISPECIES: tyrosine-protein phosphatase [unclassified Streptomyces]
MHGAVNCRDLGGCRAEDGRRLRHGRLYRSDALAELTPGRTRTC